MTKLRRFFRAFADGFGVIPLSPPRRRRVQDLPVIQSILNRSDGDAIRADWEAVGNDLRRAMEAEGLGRDGRNENE